MGDNETWARWELDMYPLPAPEDNRNDELYCRAAVRTAVAGTADFSEWDTELRLAGSPL